MARKKRVYMTRLLFETLDHQFSGTSHLGHGCEGSLKNSEYHGSGRCFLSLICHQVTGEFLLSTSDLFTDPTNGRMIPHYISAPCTTANTTSKVQNTYPSLMLHGGASSPSPRRAMATCFLSQWRENWSAAWLSCADSSLCPCPFRPSSRNSLSSTRKKGTGKLTAHESRRPANGSKMH